MKLTPSSPGFAMLISLVAWISLSASAQKTVDVRVKPEIGTARCPSVDSPPPPKAADRCQGDFSPVGERLDNRRQSGFTDVLRRFPCRSYALEPDTSEGPLPS